MKVTKGRAKKPGSEYHHGDLRRALVDAAAALAAEKGIADVSLREAARSAGVSHAAPYHHFKDKAALLAAVAEEGFIRLDAFQNKALGSASREPAARLRALGKAYVDFAIRNPHYFRVMFRKDLVEPERYPSLQEVAGRTFDRLLTAVGDCLGSSSEAEAMPLALTAWSLVHGLASLRLDGPLSTREFGGKKIRELSDEVIGEFVNVVNTRLLTSHGEHGKGR
jgi:AcrR family transcriptional regulator